MCQAAHTRAGPSASQFAEEFALVHVVFEGFVAVDEDDGDFVGEASPQFVVALYVNFAPSKATTALQFGQRFLDDFAKMAAFAGVNHDLA